ncbi:MAG: hypothetical protein J5679_01860 [Alphaproteobacteria bacterium]|nr:hypothetical protein [Alphaproteobacteria bacterium]
MKRLVVVLGGLLALPAFAEVAPFYYDAVTEYADTEIIDDGDVVADEIATEKSAISAPVIQARPTARAGATRNASRATPSSTTTGNRVQNSRVVASRGATNAVTARGTTSRATVARSAGTANSARASVVKTVSGTTPVVTDTTQKYVDSGVQQRVGVRAAAAYRAPSVGSVSVTNTTTTTAETIKEATETMDSLMELTDYCKAQYTACMDNFCNVLDDNQGRCSCSKNVKNYEKTEEALRAATEELQDVAQRIQYIGLTSEEITTLFTQTEAESAMQNTSDSTKLKNDLDRIKNMIVGVKSGSASAIGDTAGISLDLSNLLSFNIDSTGFDLSGLFGTTSSNTSSVSNQRGEALYKTAAARCKSAVLSQCTAQGVDAGVVVNSYDVEIDKQCIVYERNLSDSNTQMAATVRNAKTVLQKARLMVAQQKNQYDLRGCISALDSCMQDEYVCGTDYEGCLDPTGKFIVDGKVVVGSMPGQSGGNWESSESTTSSGGLYKTWDDTNGGNIWAPATNGLNMTQYISNNLVDTNLGVSGSDKMIVYLMNKLGYHENQSPNRNLGMCISVLNKCQDYTYNAEGKYNVANSVVKNYLERAFRQIKNSQDEILSKYATSCLSDVRACLSQNNYGFGASTDNNYSDMAIAACLPVINTCRSVTLGLDKADDQITTQNLENVYKWLNLGIGTTYSTDKTDEEDEPEVTTLTEEEQTACTASHGALNRDNTACTCDSAKGLVEDTAGKTCKCGDALPNWNSSTSACVAACEEEKVWNPGTNACVAG